MKAMLTIVYVVVMVSVILAAFASSNQSEERWMLRGFIWTWCTVVYAKAMIAPTRRTV